MIADHYLQLRTDLETALIRLLRLGADLQRSPASLETLHSLLTDIRQPLLFVVVGEVKAGKSSLLNALFGHEFAKTGVLPATDRVCIFRYGEVEKTVDVSPQLIERFLPIDFLHNFNVVDTPGTNTMVAEHQRITEEFVPRADLVLFVFSVVNPWTQSAWDFLAFIQKRWLKNIVFVLQQADLREPEEIAVIRRHLQDTALQKLGSVPPIFAVSARQALLARTGAPNAASLEEKSEIVPLEQHIDLIMADSSAHAIKLRSAWQTAQIVLREIASEVREAFRVITQDEERFDRLMQFLQARKEQTLRQVHGFVRGIDQACRDSAAQGTRFLENKLTFWTTLNMIWRRDYWQRDLQGEMETKLRQVVQPQIENAIQLLEADLRGIWPQLHDMIETHFAADVKSQAPRTPPDFARQRRELLQSIQLTLAERSGGDVIEEQLGTIFRETSNRLRIPAGVAAAGGLVTLVAAMSSAAIADVTGVLAASAAIVGTFLARRQRAKILRVYAEQMEAKRNEMVTAIENQISHAIDLFYGEMNAAVQPLTAFCTAQRTHYKGLVDRIDELDTTFEKLRPRVTGSGD
jgi:GTPase Era involved in 16S rRNA processing